MASGHAISQPGERSWKVFAQRTDCVSMQSMTDCKTAAGLHDWCRDDVTGQMGLPDCAVDLGLPWYNPAEAFAAGARSLVIGVAPVGLAEAAQRRGCRLLEVRHSDSRADALTDIRYANIKLDKTGGLTEALAVASAATVHPALISQRCNASAAPGTLGLSKRNGAHCRSRAGIGV